MKIVQLVIMVLAAIFAMSAFSVDARLNHQLVLKAMGINTVCNYPCFCTLPTTGQICICSRLWEKCYEACACICAEDISASCYCGEKNECANDVAEKPDKE